MPKKITLWECEACGEHYSGKLEAERCERFNAERYEGVKRFAENYKKLRNVRK